MQEAEPEPQGADEALAWRNELALRLIRALLVIFLASAVLIWLVMAHGQSRNPLLVCALLAAAIVSVPALSGWPRGTARGWVIIVPALVTALMGYVHVGVFSGPGVCLMVTVMLAGLLLGRRARSVENPLMPPAWAQSR